MSGKFSKLQSKCYTTGGCVEHESDESINNLWQKIYDAIKVDCINKNYYKFNNYKINNM